MIFLSLTNKVCLSLQMYRLVITVPTESLPFKRQIDNLIKLKLTLVFLLRLKSGLPKQHFDLL